MVEESGTGGTGGAASRGTPAEADGERVPVMQRVLDNPFLLLFLGVAIPTVLYLMWGVMEIAQIPIAPS